MITTQFVNDILEKIDKNSVVNTKTEVCISNAEFITKSIKDTDSSTSIVKNSDASDMLQLKNCKDVWNILLNKLKSLYGESIYNSWIKSINFIKYEKGILELSVPSKFKREMIINQSFDKKIMDIWKQRYSNAHYIEIIVAANTSESDQTNTEESNNIKQHPKSNYNRVHQKDYALHMKFTFDNFIVGKSNELAFAAAKRIAENEVIMPGTNPLFLYGGVGLGKTHLMNAIGNHIKKFVPHRKVMYLSAERFMYKYIIALKNNSIMDFKEELRSVDVLMVDDVQFISGKDSTQEEFFHTFNSLIEQKKQLIISADRSPSDLDGVEERIKSRLGWGLVADIHDTTYELRLGVLQSKAEHMSLNISSEVLAFIAKNITSNIRVLEGALYKVIHLASLGRSITIDSVASALKDLLRANQKVITIDDVIKKISEHFNVKISDLKSVKRVRNIVYPRQVAMYLAKMFTQKSLSEIGRNFGGRDHTTVIHSIKKIENKMQKDTEIESDIQILQKSIQ